MTAGSDGGTRRPAGPRAVVAAGRTLASLLRDWSVVILALLIWELATLKAGSIFFPTPVAIAARAGRLWFSGTARHLFLGDEVFDDILPSLERMFAGWLLAVLIGVSVGIAIGRLRLLSQIADPPLQFLRALPGPALIPIFLILLGTEDTMRIALIAFGSVWPILLNTIEGVRTVDAGLLQTAAIFKLPFRARLFRIVLPAASPKIFAGLRISLAIALILMVISEMVASTDGIGYQVAQAQQSFLLTDMWTGIVLLALLGFGLNAALSAVERRALRWHWQSRRRPGPA